ncbi:MAG: hypothetical protein D4R65_11635 [Verrucomicrobiaceae bacterium]|nr:MAG: hypothetical protein D4R65_11635 [Verrucomicrobiaceae bacterium]
MNSTENKPVSIGDWIVTIILLAIPVVNLIMLLVWAFGGSVHPSKKNYARATLILGVGVFVLAIALVILSTLISFPSTHPIH